MYLYVDESGSINNHNEKQPYFVIAIVYAKSKGALKGKYDKFVKQNIDRLKQLDAPVHSNSKTLSKNGNIMFKNGIFQELKGHKFDTTMKKDFLNFFNSSNSFEVLYIKLINCKLTDKFCKNTERGFNYPLKLALCYYISKGVLPNEDCYINLDNRNLKTDTKMQLDEYINTELNGIPEFDGTVHVKYYDSTKCKLVQVADVFSNIYYSNLFSNDFQDEFNEMRRSGKIKEFVFPLS